jgi:hypothetical protein
MSCRVDLIEAYVFDELEPRAALEVESHLSRCEACRREKDWLEAERAMFRQHTYAHATPPTVQSVVGRQRTNSRIRLLKQGAMACAAALSLAAGVCLVLSGTAAPDRARSPVQPMTPSSMANDDAVAEAFGTDPVQCEVEEADDCQSLCESNCGSVDVEPHAVEPVLWSEGEDEVCASWIDR